jgi:hypothetical protein
VVSIYLTTSIFLSLMFPQHGLFVEAPPREAKELCDQILPITFKDYDIDPMSGTCFSLFLTSKVIFFLFFRDRKGPNSQLYPRKRQGAASHI